MVAFLLITLDINALQLCGREARQMLDTIKKALQLEPALGSYGFPMHFPVEKLFKVNSLKLLTKQAKVIVHSTRQGGAW